MIIIFLAFLVLFIVNIFLGEIYDRRNGFPANPNIGETTLIFVFLTGPLVFLYIIYYLFCKDGNFQFKPLTLIYNFVSKFVK